MEKENTNDHSLVSGGFEGHPFDQVGQGAQAPPPPFTLQLTGDSPEDLKEQQIKEKPNDLITFDDSDDSDGEDNEFDQQKEIEKLKQLIADHQNFSNEWMEAPKSQNKTKENVEKVEDPSIISVVNQVKIKIEEIKVKYEELKKKGINGEDAATLLPGADFVQGIKDTYEKIKNLEEQYHALSFLNAWQGNKEIKGEIEAFKTEATKLGVEKGIEAGGKIGGALSPPIIDFIVEKGALLVSILTGLIIDAVGSAKKGDPANRVDQLYLEGRTFNHRTLGPAEDTLVKQIVKKAAKLGVGMNDKSVKPYLGITDNQLRRIGFIMSGVVPTQAYDKTTEDKPMPGFQANQGFNKTLLEDFQLKKQINTNNNSQNTNDMKVEDISKDQEGDTAIDSNAGQEIMKKVSTGKGKSNKPKRAQFDLTSSSKQE